MFRIAVCDDDPEGRLAADALLAEYFAAHPARAARRSLFPSGEALLRAIEEGQKFHLFLLDILMPGLGGIATGLALRERGQRGEILYLTTSAEFGVESYQARATDYLLKPVDKGRLFQDLDAILARWDRRRSAHILIHSSEGLHRLPIRQILYAERVDRSVLYHCDDGSRIKSRTLQGSFAEGVRPLLAHRQFWLCGPSFLFNLERITAVEKQRALLDGGLQVPVPRAQTGALREAWYKFWMGEGPYGGYNL